MFENDKSCVLSNLYLLETTILDVWKKILQHTGASTAACTYVSKVSAQRFSIVIVHTKYEKIWTMFVYAKNKCSLCGLTMSIPKKVTFFEAMLPIEKERTSFQGMWHSLNEGVCWTRLLMSIMYFFKRNGHFLLNETTCFKGIVSSLKECCICLKNALYAAKTFYIQRMVSFKTCAFWPEYAFILFESNNVHFLVRIYRKSTKP